MIITEMITDLLEYKAPALAEVTHITAREKTPGSDRLSSFNVACGGWTVISANVGAVEGYNGDPRYEVGQKCVYISPEVVLDQKFHDLMFPPDSKIKLDNRRLRTIKLRGAISQGLLCSLEELEKHYLGISLLKTGSDVSQLLGVTKYEPPAYSVPKNMQGALVSKKNPWFKEYVDINNYRHYEQKGIFEEAELVYVSSKLHGTSMRMACVPTHANTFWKKVKKFFRLLPKYEFALGSRRCQLQNKPEDYKTFYDDNVYQKVAKRYKFKELLLKDPNTHLFGEVIGPGIQKNYDYNLKEYEFFAYDVMINGKFLSPQEFKDWCDARGIPRVPDLGYISYNMEEITKLAEAKTCYNGQKVREGVVIKPVVEKSHPSCGRVVFKVINREYLLKDQTEFH